MKSSNPPSANRIRLHYAFLTGNTPNTTDESDWGVEEGVITRRFSGIYTIEEIKTLLIEMEQFQAHFCTLPEPDESKI